MPSLSLLILTSTLWMISAVLAYVQPFEYSAASPLIARDRAPFLPNPEPVLERRDYCGGMYCTCPNECIDDNTCTTNVALLPCGGGSGGNSCAAGKQICPDGTGCCGVNEICDDVRNTCLGCSAGFTLCGDHCCEPGTTCLAVGCQGGSGNEGKSVSSGSSSTTSSRALSTSVTSLQSVSGLGAASSTSGGSGGVPSSTPAGSAMALRDSLEKSLALFGVGWIVFLI